ncbi:MAG: tRNA lysidine(34) synthetase TilS, partial [Clostridia bacterium]|nr:tRNA lysidine(34) synthetase TilS [Clostridia bacterium]
MAIDAIPAFGLAAPGDRVLCALSGGADSVCLTHLLATRAAEYGITVAAAHFSHGLRPESAAGERELCQRLCDSLSIPLFCGEGDTAAYAAAQVVGLEEAARTLRRGFLLDAADRWQATAVATGHHLEDSAETLLFNLIRGTGGQGLQGIPPKSGRFIRPLILAEKSEILAYIGAHGLEYADDPTNFTGDNVRARMRREVFPALNGINPKAAAHLA